MILADELLGGDVSFKACSSNLALSPLQLKREVLLTKVCCPSSSAGGALQDDVYLTFLRLVVGVCLHDGQLYCNNCEICNAVIAQWNGPEMSTIPTRVQTPTKFKYFLAKQF